MKAIYTDQKPTIAAGSTQSAIQNCPCLSLSFPSYCSIGFLLKQVKEVRNTKNITWVILLPTTMGTIISNFPDQQLSHRTVHEVNLYLRYSASLISWMLFQWFLPNCMKLNQSSKAPSSSLRTKRLFCEWCREFYRDKFGQCSKLGPSYHVASSVTVSSRAECGSEASM